MSAARGLTVAAAVLVGVSVGLSGGAALGFGCGRAHALTERAELVRDTWGWPEVAPSPRPWVWAFCAATAGTLAAGFGCTVAAVVAVSLERRRTFAGVVVGVSPPCSRG